MEINVDPREVGLPMFVEMQTGEFKSVEECSIKELRDALSRSRDIDMRDSLERAIAWRSRERL